MIQIENHRERFLTFFAVHIYSICNSYNKSYRIEVRMFKRIMGFFAIVVSFGAVGEGAVFIPLRPAQMSVCPDIHGVVTITTLKNVMNFWHRIPNKGEIFCEFAAAPKTFVSTLKAACDGSNIAEERFEALVEKFPALAQAREAFYEVSNGSLNQGMVEILQELKARGCKIYAATNSGPKTYAALLKTYPVLAELFDGVVLPSHVPGKVSKPGRAYFEHMVATVRGADQRSIIFIDDSLKNVQGARSVLSYQDRVFQFKDAATLRNQLIRLGALAQ